MQESQGQRQKPLPKKIAVTTNISTIGTKSDAFICMVFMVTSSAVRQQFSDALPLYTQLSLETLSSTASTGFILQYALHKRTDKVAALDSWAYHAFKVGVTRCATNYLDNNARNLPTLAALYVVTSFIVEFSGRLATGYDYNGADQRTMQYGQKGVMAYHSMLNALTTTAGILAGELVTSHYGISRSDNFLSYLVVQYVANSLTREFVKQCRESYLSSEEVTTINRSL